MMKTQMLIISPLIFLSTFSFGQRIGINIPVPEYEFDIRSSSLTDGIELNIGNLGNQHFLRMYSGRQGSYEYPSIYWKEGDSLGMGTDFSGYKEVFRLRSDGTLRLNSEKGIVLDARDRPIITRGWDPFTGGLYAGLGRWGLFMEPNYLSIGIPDIPGRGVRFVRFAPNSGISQTMMSLQNGDMTVFGAVTLGNAQSSPVAGMIRWTGTVFEGYNGTAWTRLGGGDTLEVVIPAAAFQPSRSENEWLSDVGQGGTYLTGVNAPPGKMVAPVCLPAGSRVISMSVFFLDNASQNLTIEVYSESLFSGSFASTPFSVTTAGLSSSWQSLSLNASLVIDENYGYYMRAYEPTGVVWDPVLAVKGVRLTYVTP